VELYAINRRIKFRLQIIVIVLLMLLCCMSRKCDDVERRCDEDCGSQSQRSIAGPKSSGAVVLCERMCSVWWFMRARTTRAFYMCKVFTVKRSSSSRFKLFLELSLGKETGMGSYVERDEERDDRQTEWLESLTSFVRHHVGGDR
jgi:hypothetical protein